jgi:glycosyltransferase involved in cell wall biosynthesis
VLRYVRESLCVFYPQTVHAETFGLVFAEANAVGTPVLAHDFGAAREVLSNPEQLVDGKDPRALIAKLRAWHDGARAQVAARPEFRASAVIAEWLRLVEELVAEQVGRASGKGGLRKDQRAPETAARD